jgi:hypothetical protein
MELMADNKCQSLTAATKQQGCQTVYSQTKNPKLGTFLMTFGIDNVYVFCGLL